MAISEIGKKRLEKCMDIMLRQGTPPKRKQAISLYPIILTQGDEVINYLDQLAKNETFPNKPSFTFEKIDSEHDDLGAVRVTVTRDGVAVRYTLTRKIDGFVRDA